MAITGKWPHYVLLQPLSGCSRLTNTENWCVGIWTASALRRPNGKHRIAVRSVTSRSFGTSKPCGNARKLASVSIIAERAEPRCVEVAVTTGQLIRRWATRRKCEFATTVPTKWRTCPRTSSKSYCSFQIVYCLLQPNSFGYSTRNPNRYHCNASSGDTGSSGYQWSEPRRHDLGCSQCLCCRHPLGSIYSCFIDP